jgi:integrase
VGKKTGRRSVNKGASFISTFFKWAMASGYRKHGNPVSTLLHRQPQPKRKPRPFDQAQLTLAWDLLNERGNARLRLAAAIAEESGMRLGEICRLRLQDVFLTQRSLFVRLPNKGNVERDAFFGEKTVRYYAEWLAVRDPRCAHDRLLHNTLRNPCTVASLGQEFNGVLCKVVHGQSRNVEGFDKWSTHRMRHTMASRLANGGADAATIMAVGGWKTFEAMCLYTQVDEGVARRGYDEAIQKDRALRHSAPRKKSLSITELLELKRKKA